MSLNRYDYAYECVNEIRKNMNLTYPINPFDILDFYRIDYIAYSKIGIDGSSKENRESYAHITYLPKTYKPIILYNDYKDYDVLRFSLMHELGHYLCGHYNNNKADDKIANCFARNIISPPDLVKPGSNIFDISVSFGLSSYASIVRLDNLKRDFWYFSKI